MENINELKEKIKQSTDSEFILEALKHNEKLQEDIEVMSSAVKVDGQALYYASKEIRDNREIVMEAVTKKGLILKYASYQLRNDKEIVMEAIKQDKRAFDYIATDELKQDPDVVALIS